MKNNKITYEEALLKLEEITSMMENSDTPLEKTASLYKEAIELALICSEKLTAIEGEISVLKKEADGIFKKEKISL